MKRLVSGAVAAAALAVASTSYAADMAYKAPPPAPAPYNWTGFYAGFNAGWTWADSDDVHFNGFDHGGAPFFADALRRGLFPPAHNTSRDGFIGGFQAGYNWQTGVIVWGIEADIQYSGARASYAIPIDPSAGTNSTLFGHADLEWFGTVRGRVGWLATPMTLIYATGGFIYGKNDTTVNFRCTNCGLANPERFATGDGNNSGWTVGGGLEYALGGGWSAKGEYLYYEFDNNSATISVVQGPVNSTLTGTVDTAGHIVRFGVNYKFGGGGYGKAPVVARY
jgi:outer membrane immunogenic protein